MTGFLEMSDQWPERRRWPLPSTMRFYVSLLVTLSENMLPLLLCRAGQNFMFSVNELINGSKLICIPRMLTEGCLFLD